MTSALTGGPSLSGVRPRKLAAPLVALASRYRTGRWWSETELECKAEPDSVAENEPHRQGFEDGTGDLLLRRYEISLSGTTRQPAEIITVFRSDPNRFAPTRYAEFEGDLNGEGEKAVVRLPGPWDGPVEVVDDEPHRLRLATLDGHMEAGWIQFSVTDTTEPRFCIESAARAGGVAFWILHELVPIARWVQTDMWCQVAEAAARYCGVSNPPQVKVTTIRPTGTNT